MSARAALRLLAIALVLVVCLPAFMIASLVGRGSFWMALFLRGVGRVLGLRVRTTGRPVAGDVLYAANHISWLDILALGGAARTRFIAKSEIADWALVGRLATMVGSVFVSRDRRSSTRVQADAIARALNEGRPITLFAEGSTGDGVTLDPFRPSLFAAAVEARATVQPVAIDYGARSAEIAWPDDTRFSTEMLRILDRRGGIAVTLHFLPPLDAAMLDRKALAIAAHAAVAVALGRTSSAPSGARPAPDTGR